MTAKALLTSEDLPEQFRRADAQAVVSQRRHLWVIKTQITGLMVPVLAGVLDAIISGSQPVLTIISVVSLTIVAVTRLMQRFVGYESSWHSARAVAEAIRSLSWQYASGGSVFQGVSLEQANIRFLDEVGELPIPSAAANTSEPEPITNAMQELRDSTFETRRDVYVDKRLSGQLDWYLAKAEFASRRGRLWDWMFVGSASLAVVFGIAQVTGAIEVGLVSLFGLTAAVIGTWTGVNQFGSLQATYTNTAVQLEPMLRKAGELGETEWPAFITATEEIMAAEHRIWLVKRR